MLQTTFRKYETRLKKVFKKGSCCLTSESRHFLTGLLLNFQQIYIYVYTYGIRICIFVCMYVHIYIYIFMCTYIYMYTHIYIYTFVYVCVLIHIYIYTLCSVYCSVLQCVIYTRNNTLQNFYLERKYQKK